MQKLGQPGHGDARDAVAMMSTTCARVYSSSVVTLCFLVYKHG